MIYNVNKLLDSHLNLLRKLRHVVTMCDGHSECDHITLVMSVIGK